MTKDEALKLALEALEEFGEHYDWCHQFPTYAFPENYPPCNCGYDEAITAIKEALAQPEQEPVAWRYKILDYFGRPVWTLKTPKTDIRVLESQPLYTTPPQRKPLTDEEIEDIWADCPADWDDKINVLTLARAIEAAHGIKEEA